MTINQYRKKKNFNKKIPTILTMSVYKFSIHVI
jgi:hypothetical protein